MNVEKATAHLTEEYVQAIYGELIKSDHNEWPTSGVKALLQFSFQIFGSMHNGYLNDSGTIRPLKLQYIYVSDALSFNLCIINT